MTWGSRAEDMELHGKNAKWVLPLPQKKKTEEKFFPSNDATTKLDASESIRFVQQLLFDLNSEIIHDFQTNNDMPNRLAVCTRCALFILLLYLLGNTDDERNQTKKLHFNSCTKCTSHIKATISEVFPISFPTFCAFFSGSKKWNENQKSHGVNRWICSSSSRICFCCRYHTLSERHSISLRKIYNLIKWYMLIDHRHWNCNYIIIHFIIFIVDKILNFIRSNQFNSTRSNYNKWRRWKWNWTIRDSQSSIIIRFFFSKKKTKVVVVNGWAMIPNNNRFSLEYCMIIQTSFIECVVFLGMKHHIMKHSVKLKWWTLSGH